MSHTSDHLGDEVGAGEHTAPHRPGNRVKSPFSPLCMSKPAMLSPRVDHGILLRPGLPTFSPPEGRGFDATLPGTRSPN